jgi:hypothetical protein
MFSYSPSDRVTISLSGDVSLTDGSTTTTFTKIGATKTVTKTPPEASPSGLETPLTQKIKPNGDLIHTYSDITKTPPVTTRITFRPNGDVEILVTIGQDRTLVDVNGMSGVRRTKLWKDPDPEPEKWARTDSPRSGAAGGGASGNGSKHSKKPKKPSRKAGRKSSRKAARKPLRRSHPAKRRAATRSPKKKSKGKARRR